MKTELRYCVFDPDQRGNARHYVRYGGRKIRIREIFKDENGHIHKKFMQAYWDALAVLQGKAEATQKPTPPREDTFDWLCDQYFRSAKFKGYDPATQRDKRSVLTRFCETAGKLPYQKYRKEDMENSQQKRKATPGAADKLVKVIRALFSWAMDQKPPLASFNPAARVQKINRNTDGFHTWTPDEIDRFRAHWPLGSKPRLAMEVMINVGARRSDACRIGPKQEYRGRDNRRWLRFTAYKGRDRYPTTIDARLTTDLVAALDKTAHGTDAYVLSQRQSPYTKESFSNAFKDWCADADMPHCNCHGLRKAAAVIYAESGATAPELCALFGWTNLRTAQIYIDKADKRRMSANAQERLEEHQRNNSVSLSRSENPSETKNGESDEKSI